MSKTISIGICFMLSTVSLLRAAVVDGYSLTANDRFADSVDFIGVESDWSGVGMTPAGRWATLIGPNTVISAGHFPPSGIVNFFSNNDPDETPVQREIVGGRRIENTDIWVGCLDELVPNTITPFAIATEMLNSGNFASSSYASAHAFVVGRSPSTHPVVQDMTVGQNVVVGYGENDVFRSGLGSNVDSLSFVFDRQNLIAGLPNPDYVDFESHLEVGDSGAPLLVARDGELVLIGVNSFITQADNLVSHASYVGNESDEIHQYVQHCLSQIPEPESQTMFLFLFIVAFLKQRNRREALVGVETSQVAATL